MRTIEYYRNYEEQQLEGRGDRAEGSIGVFQPDQATFEFSHPSLRNGEPIRLTGITDQVLVGSNDLADKFVFCLTSVDDVVAARKLAGDGEQIFDRRNTAFGQHSLVIHSPGEFLSKVREAAVRSGLGVRWGFVEYYDRASHNGMFQEETWGFQKDRAFEYQNEFRIRVGRLRAAVGDSFDLGIGDISGISAIIESGEVDRSLRIERRG